MPYIPPPPGEFYGRQREIARLLSFFPTQKVMIIAGLAGIGKTALALTFADSVSRMPEYQDKVMWVTCQHGWNSEDLFAQIIKQLATFAGKIKEISDTLEGSPEGVIRLIEKNCLAVFIDDFHLVENETSRSFIRLAKEFLSKGKLVVTTRKRVALSPLDRVDLFERRLDGLALEDCRKLIEKLLKFHGFEDLTEEKFSKIYYKVKGHPFSIKLFISLMVSGGFSLDSLLDTSSEFEEEMERFLLDKVWEILEKSEQEVLKSLSIIRIPIKAEEYPLLATPILKKALRQLIDNYLIEYNKEGRIFIHDLLKDYASHKLDDKFLKKLHLQAAEYFHQKTPPEIAELKEAYYHYHEAGKVREAVQVIIKINEHFILQGEETEHFYHLVNDAIANCADNFREDLIKIKIWLLIYWNKFKEAEELAGEVKNPQDKIFIGAKISLQKGQYHEALKGFTEAQDNPNGDAQQLEILNGMAICNYYLGDWKKAEQYYLSSLELLKKHERPLMKGRVLSNFAVMLSTTGDLYRAIEYYQEAEKLYRQTNNLSLLSNVIYNKAMTYINMQELDRAREALKESMEIKEKIVDNQGMIYHLNLLGGISFLEGEYEASLQHNRQALKLAEKCGEIKLKTVIYCDFGRALTRMGKLEEAEANFHTAFEISTKADSRLYEAMLKQEYAQYLLVKGEREPALKYLEEVREFALAATHKELLVKSLYFLYRTGELLQDKHACDYSAEYQKKIAEVPNPLKERVAQLFKWYEDYVFTTEEKGFFLITPKGKKSADTRDLGNTRAERDKFEIFIDFIEHELLIRGKKVKFFKKRTLVPLLYVLAAEPGKIFDFATLFEAVWGRKYDVESDGVTLRVNISRLRSIMGEKKGKEIFVRSSPDVGGYHFNSQTDYCIIIPSRSEREFME
ncbi:MAG: tetratricopeptide repeat protein [Candidatus Wallbacteria bacterium]|nr:tetratricopeptide repeat protein [Candidatus Wallbacteria bacterium]